MTQILALLGGLFLGGIVAWLWASSKAKADISSLRIEAEGKTRAAETRAEELRIQVTGLEERLKALQGDLDTERSLKTTAETRLDEANKKFAEEKELLEFSKNKLREAFVAIAADALRNNNEAFLQLANARLEAAAGEAEGELDARQTAISQLVKPLKDALDRYEGQVRVMEQARATAYGTLEEQLRNLATANEQLLQRTGELTTALRAPQVRGRWGEMTLHRVAELTGMSDKCDFTEQESFTTEAGRQRPDMIVNLPGGRRIAVDAKAPLSAFADAAAATGDEERKKALEAHARAVRAHMTQLSSRQYWQQFEPAPELVVLFLPGESFFSAALEQDARLIEDGIQSRVVLATPTTLIALLHAVAYGWRQQTIEENARKISDLGKELHDRIRTFADHIAAAGKSLEAAMASHNRAVGSLESRVLVSARKFKELGATTGADIPELTPIETAVRQLAATEGDSQ